MLEIDNTYYCCNDERKNLVLKHPDFNGIDFIEVSADQKTLYLHFLKPIGAGDIEKDNIKIIGGERIKNIKVVSVDAFPGSPEVLEIKVDQAGDFSCYTLMLIDKLGESKIFNKFDKLLSQIDFSFKIACPKDFDCKNENECDDIKESSPPFINYLAKDYSSFRKLIKDRFSQLLPQWNEDNPADLGIALVEILAYLGDNLSYRQDALTTEAYLGTSRRRISATRHARLSDYKVSNGCNARTWMYVPVNNDGVLPKGTQFFTKMEGKSPVLLLDNSNPIIKNISDLDAVTVFESMYDNELKPTHNLFHFCTFDASECCLPQGATSAVLREVIHQLEKGDYLMIMEAKGSKSGKKEDADFTRRHVVKLIKVEKEEVFDYQENKFINITNISWDKSDALPFPVCISTDNFKDVSLVLGNIVLADHGCSFNPTENVVVPDLVPVSLIEEKNNENKDFCEGKPRKLLPIRYYPELRIKNLTFSEHTDFKNQSSAKSLLVQNPNYALPTISLNETTKNEKWETVKDLLIDSRSSDKHFVVEQESYQKYFLRFGNDENGERPNTSMRFTANFRIGNGRNGNISLSAIKHICVNNPGSIKLDAVFSVTNLFPAYGGQNAESLEQIKLNAPIAFRTQERAVTNDDYSFFATKADSGVQKAICQRRWTGSWLTNFISIDNYNNEDLSAIKEKVFLYLDKKRLAGIDLKINDPLYISLTIELDICVDNNYFKEDVLKKLTEKFSTRKLSNGGKGLFHPDNFTFGTTLYLSSIYEVAQSVQGVLSVKIKNFHKQINPLGNNQNIQNGKIDFSVKEILRLDNNPNYKDRGVITFNIKGGKQ
ncbi:MAG: hypothetical protein KA536_15950 [Saprospiraceae bacterium]|nr:hypothetical protein [Saprospiraceae bacterium]